MDDLEMRQPPSEVERGQGPKLADRFVRLPTAFSHKGDRYEPAAVQMYGRSDWVVNFAEFAHDGTIFEGHVVLFRRVPR